MWSPKTEVLISESVTYHENMLTYTEMKVKDYVRRKTVSQKILLENDYGPHDHIPLWLRSTHLRKLFRKFRSKF